MTEDSKVTKFESDLFRDLTSLFPFQILDKIRSTAEISFTPLRVRDGELNSMFHQFRLAFSIPLSYLK